MRVGRDQLAGPSARYLVVGVFTFPVTKHGQPIITPWKEEDEIDRALPGADAELPGADAEPGPDAKLPGPDAELPGAEAELPGADAEIQGRRTRVAYDDAGARAAFQIRSRHLGSVGGAGEGHRSSIFDLRRSCL